MPSNTNQTPNEGEINAHGMYNPELELTAALNRFSEEIRGFKEAITAQTVCENLVQDVVDKKEAAEFLGISVRSLERLISRNAVPHRRVGGVLRFSRKKLTEWLAGERKE